MADSIQDEVIGELIRTSAKFSARANVSKQLLEECLEFMNKVPNNKYGNHYKLCVKVEEYLKSVEE